MFEEYGLIPCGCIITSTTREETEVGLITLEGYVSGCDCPLAITCARHTISVITSFRGEVFSSNHLFDQE